MKAANKVTVEEGGKITLPDIVCSKYDLSLNTSIRIIETKTGILLIPLTQELMSEALASELSQWQALGVESWEVFP